MSKVHAVTMLMPKYVAEFQCAGPDCPDSCCQRFAVHVDQQTFREYRHSKDEVLRPMFKLHLQRNQKDSPAAQYGFLRFDPDSQECSFQDDTGWCEIHRRLGEAMLPDVCYTYPRHNYVLGDHFEQIMGLTCPEAARLALTMDCAFEFVEQERFVRSGMFKPLLSQDGLSINEMEDVRIFAVQICQSPDLSLLQKWVALGWFSWRLDELIPESGGKQLPALLNEIKQLLLDGVLQEVAEKLPFRPDLQAKVFSTIFSAKGLRRSDLPWRSDVFDAVARGLGADNEGMVSEEELIERYCVGLQVIGNNIVQFESILTRYLLNEVLHSLFPWGVGGAQHRFRWLLTQFGIVRFMLVACTANRGSMLSDIEMVQIIQVFCRTYQHDAFFAKTIGQVLAEGAWSALGNLYELLRHSP
jgi:lysine-N-methylase